MNSSTDDDPNFRLVAKGLIALHRLIRDNRDDSPEGDAIRDSLDVPLRALDQSDKERTQWLSEDLYSISEPTPSLPRPNVPIQIQEAIRQAIEARQRGDWDQSLTLLRQSRQYMMPAELSGLRGAIWLAAGYPDVAAVFYAHAAECALASASFRSTHHSASPGSQPVTTGDT